MYSRFWCEFPTPPPLVGYWSESICFGKRVFVWDHFQWFPYTAHVRLIFISLTQHASCTALYSGGDMFSYQRGQFCHSVCKCLKFILILKSANCIARAGLLSFCKMPVLPPQFFWVISAICLAAWRSLSWSPQHVARRLIEVRVEKWVESQMALYLTCKTNKHRVGALPIMFHHSILSTFHVACDISGI